MFLIVISIILITIVSLSIWFRQSFILYKRKVDKMLENVKMFGGNVPFFGHSLYLSGNKIDNTEDYYKILEEIVKDLNEDRRLWIFNIPVIIATTPNMIEKILTNPLAVEKSYVYKFFNYIVKYGVFVATTIKWRKMRKRLNMTFNPKFFPFFIDQMNLQVYTFVREARKRLISEENGYKNILPSISRLYFDTISSTHFGLNSHRQFQTSSSAIEAAGKFTEIISVRGCKPLLHLDFIFYRTANFQKCKSMFKRHFPYLEAIARLSQKFQKKIDRIGNSLGWKSYAELIKEGMEEMDMKPNSSKIGNGIFDILIAGSDTASVATSHLLYQLGLHHEYQDIAYNEIMEVLHNDSIDSNETKSNGHNNYNKELINENNNIKTDILLKEMNNTRNNTMGKGIILESISNKTLSESDVNDEANWVFTDMTKKENIIWTKRKLDRLQLLEQMIKESLRLCSPATLLRTALVDIDMGDFVMPKGTEILISTLTAQRNPKYWEKPDTFYPEHFDPEKVKSRPKYTYLPFSHGPRDCPGKVYGMYLMKCLVAEILRNFKVETKPPTSPVTYKLVFMVEHSDGYQIRFIPRD